MKIETTLEQMKESHDWKEAFGYAGKDSCLQGQQDPPEPVLNYSGSLEPFGLDDVVEIFGSSDGEHDEREWVCVGRLRDDRYFTLAAGCDYTGWDCQASGRAHVGESLVSVVALGLDSDQRARLGVTT